ncbi:hypothetical protein CHUAL_009957 [Chamberlinius hualienensis]
MDLITVYLVITLLTNTVTISGSSKNCPMMPWSAVNSVIKEAEAQTTVFFINDTSGMPLSMISKWSTEVNISMTKISLFQCPLFTAEKTLSESHSYYFNDIKNECMRMACTFVVTCNSSITEHVTKLMVSYNLFRPWTLWISGDDTIIKQLQILNLGGTGVPIAIPLPPPNDSECSNAMAVYSKSNNRMQLLAEFTDEANNDFTHLFLTGTAGKVSSYRILDLLNDTINVAVKVLPPYLDFDYTELGNRTVKNYKGVCIKILETFASIMNFRYTLIPYDEIGIKSIVNGQSKWGGLIGAVTNKSVDLALGAITITVERANAVEFTAHFLEDTSSILSRKPPILSRILIFFQIFPWQVWLLLFISVFIVGPILAVFEYAIKSLSVKKCFSELDIWGKCWDVATAIIQQGDITVESTAARLLSVFWLFFTIILVGTYSGLLLATVTFPGTRQAIEILQQLTNENSPFPVAIHPSTTESYIKEGNTPVTSAIAERWAKISSVAFPQTPTDALNYLSDDTYVLLSEHLTFQCIIARQLKKCECCPFYEAKTHFLKHYYSFMTPKNSALLGSLNIILHRLLQTGIIDKWLRESLPDISQCRKTEKPSDGSHRPMSLLDMQGAFYILIIGHSIAVLALIMEKGFSKTDTKVITVTPS